MKRGSGVANMKKRCLIVFLKWPEPGAVKTRLAETVGEEEACLLYRCFVLDLLETLGASAETGSFGLKIYYDPPEAGRPISGWLGKVGKGYEYLPQRGNDLGERMKNAFAESFAAGFGCTLLVGSDVPDLPGEAVLDGFASLEQKDAVIGPTRDGGYCLIGFSSGGFLPDAFSGIAWSGAEVLEGTLATLRSAGRSVELLPLQRDIDTIEDLLALRERHREGPFRDSRTIRRLMEKPSVRPAPGNTSGE